MTRRVLAALRANWIVLLVVGFIPLFGALALTSVVIEQFWVERAGVEGHVIVADCKQGGRGSWDCSGNFVSDDGTIRIEGVSIKQSFGNRPAYRSELPAKVAGPSADTAYTEGSQWIWPALGAGVFFYLLGYLVAQTVKDEFEEEEQRRANAKPEKSDRQEVAPVGGEPKPIQPAVPEPAALQPAATAQRGGIVLGKVLAGWLLLILTIAAVLWKLRAWQQGRPAESSTLTAVGGRLLTDGGIVVLAWLAVLPALALSVAWAWRLSRWAAGASMSGTPATAQVYVAEVGGEPVAVWLELSSEGQIRYQRVHWDRRLMRWLAGHQRHGDQDVATQEHSAAQETTARTHAPPSLHVDLRRCPGPGRMYVVDAVGVGRLWPASRARSWPSFTYHRHPFDLDRLGTTVPASRHLRTLTGVALPTAMAWLWSGAVGAVFVLALLAGFLLWLGSIPLRGLYAVRPAPDH